jgi:hypothetical protein
MPPGASLTFLLFLFTLQDQGIVTHYGLSKVSRIATRFSGLSFQINKPYSEPFAVHVVTF